MSKNKKQPTVTKKAALPPKEPWAPRRSLLVILFAVAIAFAVLSGVFGGLLIGYAAADRAETAGFRYDKTKISDYIENFSAALVTGKTDIPGKDVKPTGVDEKSVKAYINGILLDNATAANGEKTEKHKEIGYADYVSVYLLEVTLDGERVETDHFENAYQVGWIQIGRETFGEDFDDKLIGLIPSETGSIIFLSGGDAEPKAGDVLSVSYTATIEGEDVPYESWSNIRLDTAAPRNEALCEAILNGCEAVGQRFSFDLTHDIDEDGEDEKVSYSVTVNAVVLEEGADGREIASFEFKLPEDYFTENQDEEYTSLNGKTLGCRLVIESMVDYDAKTCENMTKEDMKKVGYTASADTDAEREKCIEFVTKSFEESYDETEKKTAISLIWETLLAEISFTTLPEQAVEEAYEMLYGQLLNEFYNNNGNSVHPDLNDFGVHYYGYDTEEYEDLASYLNEYLVPNYVKQQLLVHGIYKNLIDDPKDAKLKAAYDKTVDELVAAQIAAGYSVTEEQIIEYYGEDQLRATAINELVQEYLLANNSVNWELAPEIEE